MTTKWTPWRFVTAFGVVSLLSDVVYQGARSVVGPYLATLGASAAVVGLVTGVGEAFALAGRLVTGPLADRTRAYWTLALVGYAVTIFAVPVLGLTTLLWVAAALVIAERAGKAIRSPARDVMLSYAASAVGRGRAFAVHEALDQIGAVAGPLIVAAVLAATADDYRSAFLTLTVPGVAAMVVLLWLRRRVPEPRRFEPALARSTVLAPGTTQPSQARAGIRLPRLFWIYLGFATLTTTGYATFGVLSFHLARTELVAVAAIPIVYAAAMGVDGIAAVGSGWLYDRGGLRVLALVPVLSAIVPVLAFATAAPFAVLGVLIWGAVLGVQESTMRAAVAELVPASRRGTAYGIFGAGLGLATLAGGVVAGTLYDVSVPALITVVGAIQAAALAIVLTLIAAARRTPTPLDR